ncbi:MAG: copper transport protein [Cryptosporangiaceae bacterium]|nr:copper transport protein [Cryptosporangiaceae bacterium]
MGVPKLHVTTTRAPRMAGRLLAVLAVAALALLAPAAPASAHAALLTTTPAAGTVTPSAPGTVRLQFSEPVEVTADAIRVLGPDGKPIATAAQRDRSAADTITAPLPRGLLPGTYAVRWHVISIDGHAVSGEFRFANKSASAPLTSTQAAAPSGPSVLGATGRAVAVSGALALLGLLAFPLVMVRLRRDPEARIGPLLARRIRRPVAGSAAAAIVGTLAIAVDTVAQSAAAPLTRAVTLVPQFLAVSRTGELLLARLVLIALAAALALAVKRGIGPALAAATLALGTFSLSSHAAAAASDSVVAIGFDALHLAAAALWAGGLLGLALAGLPAARELGGRDKAAVGDLAGQLSARFSIVAQLAMLVLLTTGGYATLLRIDEIRDFGGSSWGIELTVKLALFATVLLFAAASALTFVPMLAGRVAALTRRIAAADELRSAIRIELGLALGLVAVAALMSATAPPDPSVAPGGGAGGGSAARITTARADSVGFEADVQTERVGEGADAATVFTIALFTEATPASAPAASASLRGPDGVARTVPLLISGEGRWTTGRLLVDPGKYQLTTTFNRLGSPVVIPVPVTVPQ